MVLNEAIRIKSPIYESVPNIQIAQWDGSLFAMNMDMYGICLAVTWMEHCSPVHKSENLEHFEIDTLSNTHMISIFSVWIWLFSRYNGNFEAFKFDLKPFGIIWNRYGCVERHHLLWRTFTGRVEFLLCHLWDARNQSVLIVNVILCADSLLFGPTHAPFYQFANDIA